MKRFRFPLAVAVTSLGLVVVLLVTGGLLVGSALASGSAGAQHAWGPGGAQGAGPGFAVPPELAGLRDIPAAERFGHFKGAQVSVTDQNGQPLTIAVTPGTATAASATSLTLAANDGSARTFALDDQTIIHGKPVRGGAQATEPTIAPKDQVIVVTLNGKTTAVGVAGADGFGPRGPFSR